MSLGIEKAFILAGGKGERLHPLTLETAKPLVEVAGKPILQWNIELLAKYGVEEIVLGIGHLGHQVQHHFGDGSDFGLSIAYSVEQDFLGTAGALKLAEHYLDDQEIFIMMNGDEVKDVRFEKVKALFDREKAEGCIALTRVSDVSEFGSVKLDGERITDFLEKSQSPQNEQGLVNCGAYILRNTVLDLIPTGKKVSIEKEVFPALAKQGKLFGIEATGQWFPTDDLPRLEKARAGWKTAFV
ncbi:MAG: nucleotidyltransferase family protein [Candidatus Diapherotrites archaeon]|nr:nucleotidyltransferase family protein [Candidatus Diapherotrites archaeon]